MATRYVLLEQHDDEFAFVDVVEAEHGPAQAVRLYTEDHPADDEGEQLYVAVPVRNWNVVPRRVFIPAPRVEVGEIDADEWLAGFQATLADIRAQPETPTPDDDIRPASPHQDDDPDPPEDDE